jgi:UV DNA damage endonuclease
MIGYCCINMTLTKQKIKVNRGMIKKTFMSKGLSYVSELVKLNLDDTLKILKWNLDNNILLYRLSSDSFPWMSEYEFKDLPDFEKIKNKLIEIGTFIKTNNMRVSYHPGPFNVLASLNQDVVNKTIKELNKHAEIMDLMQLDKTHYYPINIHVNITKPTLEDAMQRFCENFNKLSDSCKKRLTIENDDSVNQFSVKDLYEGVYKVIGVPIVFDQHHYNYGKKDQSMQEALEMAISTWNGITPITHMSSSKLLETAGAKKTAHADYIYEKIETFGYNFDTELECKQKELAVIKYKNEQKINI